MRAGEGGGARAEGGGGPLPLMRSSCLYFYLPGTRGGLPRRLVRQWEAQQQEKEEKEEEEEADSPLPPRAPRPLPARAQWSS